MTETLPLTVSVFPNPLGLYEFGVGFNPSTLFYQTCHRGSESLGHELPFGIRVVLVEPAYTRTSFEENLARPDQLLDIYDVARAGMKAILRKAIETGDAPEV